jgi:hypothetical protein
MDQPDTLASCRDNLIALAADVLRTEGGVASIVSRQGVAAVAIRPARASACPVELWADLEREQVGLLIGVDATPYERVYPGLRASEVWDAALNHLRDLLTAIVRGRYRQERRLRRNGDVVLIHSVFELPAGEYDDVVRRSLSTFRRTRQEHISFEQY